MDNHAAVSASKAFDDWPSEIRIELRIANLATRVVLFTPEGHEDRIGTAFNGSFYCDDVSATHRQLTARGASNSFQRRSGSRGENIAIFKDPDGNPFVLSSA